MKYHDVMPPVPPNPSLQATPVPASVALPPPTVAHRWRSALHDGAWNVGGCLGSPDVLLWSASEASSMAAVVCHYPRGGGGTDQKFLRIYADESGASHCADIDIPLVPMKLFPAAPPISLSAWFTATAVRFAWVPVGMCVADWHTTPVRQLVVWLTGWVECETSDGVVHRCEPGTVVHVEDTCGRGHFSRHPEEGQSVMFAPVPDGLAVP